MGKRIKEMLEKQIASQAKGSNAQHNSSPIRTVRCHLCDWYCQRRRRNGWGDTAYLRGQLNRHIAEAHSQAENGEVA